MATTFVNYKNKKKSNDKTNIINNLMRKKIGNTKNVNYCNYNDEAYKKYYLTNFKDFYHKNNKLKNCYLGKKVDISILTPSSLNCYNLINGENQISIINNILSQSCKTNKITKTLTSKTKVDDIYVPNLYTNFKSIHFYFTSFCYYMYANSDIYGKLLNLIKICKNNESNYLNIIENNRENLRLIKNKILSINKKKTFAKILEYMHKYNYRLVPSSKYITDKQLSHIDFHEILKSNVETHKIIQNINQTPKINNFSAFVFELLYIIYHEVYNEIYKSFLVPIVRDISDKILDDGIKIALFEGLSSSKNFFKSIKNKPFSLKNILNILSSEKNKRLIGEFNYASNEILRCIKNIDAHINVWTSNIFKHGLVVFRGTNPFEKGYFNIKTDLDLSLRQTNENARVLLNRYIYDNYIYKFLKNKYIITFTGHSLGGLIARNININIKDELARPYLVITYNHFSDKSIVLNNEFHIYTKYDYVSKGTIYNNNLNDILYYNSNWTPILNTNILSNHSLKTLEPLFNKK